MAFEAKKPYHQVSSSNHGLIPTLCQNNAPYQPLCGAGIVLELTPAFEGLAFWPCRGLCQLFPCSTVAGGNWWDNTGPFQDPGRFSLRLLCFPLSQVP